MPSLEVDSHGVPAVAAFSTVLEELLAVAEGIKRTSQIEPALNKSDFEHLEAQLLDVFPAVNSTKTGDNTDQRKAQRFAIIETAVRDMFSNLIATTSIESPKFVRVWNLFDILSILSDSEQCDPALLFWLVEELLDSQTIAGCRKIFDFLESRRERITAKHFKQKQLVILRSCNELLRRLSRAEDTAFCGRVFIFMFQSFPLGDKSSVNLRGEYHLENVTAFDQNFKKTGEGVDKMDVDAPADGATKEDDPKAASKGVSFEEGKNAQSEKPLDPDTLYPMFWSLQESFSQPKGLFDSAHFAVFKTGLQATISAFRSMSAEQGARPAKQVDEVKRGPKRKREDGDNEQLEETEESAEGEMANSFNPKYLTSRDLFELEISDLSFRRHILVQALIIMDFLLSLSAKAKEKLATVKAQNKSVTYTDQVLSEEDATWAAEMKRTIADYLRQGSEGPYFFRMVETVLSRDKNWVRWKIENCPSIEMPTVSPDTFNDARAIAQKTTTNKRLRPTPMGSLSLGFLAEGEESALMDKFKAEDRYELPDIDVFKRKIADDDFEIEMPTDNQTKAAAVESKASKSWRALRIASRSRLAAFDKIDNPDKIDVIFEEPAAGGESEELEGSAAAPTDLPDDRRPLIIAGPRDSYQSSLVALLLERRPGVFGVVAPHTTRAPGEGETNGRDYHFVDAQKFSVMRDGDQLLEYSEGGSHSQGTSRKVVDAVSESGKVPLLRMNRDGVQQVKDLSYSARFVFLGQPGLQSLKASLAQDGVAEEQAEAAIATATEELETAKSGKDFYDLAIVDGDGLEKACEALEAFIWGGEPGEDGVTNGTGGDVDMNDAAEGGVGQAQESGRETS